MSGNRTVNTRMTQGDKNFRSGVASGKINLKMDKKAMSWNKPLLLVLAQKVERINETPKETMK